MNDPNTTVFFTIFPFFFIGMWLFITSLLGLLSGWFELQRRYPDHGEAALLTIRRSSGSMGVGVAMSGILTLAACPSGLRVSTYRVFGMFQRPFLVPWDEIAAERTTIFFVPMAKLRLGAPQIGRITIDARTWQRLAAHSPFQARLRDRYTPVPKRSVGRGLALQWTVITAVAASFFILASRLSPDAPPVPLILCLGFPALAFGIPQLVRYMRQRGG